jgi:hypothetical protein
MTLTGGFRFGLVPGTAMTAVAATAGATLIFLAAKAGFGDALRRRLTVEGSEGDRGHGARASPGGARQGGGAGPRRATSLSTMAPRGGTAGVCRSWRHPSGWGGHARVERGGARPGIGRQRDFACQPGGAGGALDPDRVEHREAGDARPAGDGREAFGRTGKVEREGAFGRHRSGGQRQDQAPARAVGRPGARGVSRGRGTPRP